MTLEFPIDATDTAMGLMANREHRAEAASIEKFFNARSIAVIGASRREATIGQVLVRNLVMGNFSGRVYAVNPTSESVSGLPTFATVGEIPDEVDVAIVAVPAEAVPDVVLDCAAKGVHGLVVISSGFAETGEEGRQRQRRLVGLARSYGLRLIGPNCLGIINTAPGMCLNASLSPVKPPRGRAGFFCQSGALGSAILEKVNNRGLGLSTFVSAGNRADVSGNDLLAVLGGGRRDRGGPALPRVDRQPPQVLADRPPGLAAQADHRGPLGPDHPGRADGARGPADRRPAAGRRRHVPPGRRDPGRHAGGDVRRRPAARPPAAAPRTPGGDRGQLRRARPAGRRRRVLGRPGREQVGGARSRGHRRGLRGRPRRGDRRPRRRLRGRGLHPPAERLRRGRRQRAGRRRRAVRQAAGVVVPGIRGGPGAAAGPRRRREHGRPRLRAVVPRCGGGGPRAGPRRRVRRVVAHPGRADRRRPRRPRPGRGQAARGRGAGQARRRHRAGPGRAHRAAGRLRDRAVGVPARHQPARGAGGRKGPRLGRRAQGDRRPPARAPRPGPRVAQHRHRRRRCATRGSPSTR